MYHGTVGVPQPLRIIRERYRLDALIGEGGMASVWRAWDLTLQRPIAVKLLFPRDSHTTEALVDRFLREARIAASVQHRNVIHIVDFGTTLEGQPFMVMELLEGETLAARLRREKPLPVPDVVQIGHLTLRGLGAVHAAGIIHRDLKPENVYLKMEGGVVYPKILDFGISRSIEPAARSALTTRDGVIVGTPEYMSPEQARGVKQLDYRTDIYSMGVVLYEALTGRLPYTSENVGDLIIKIVTGCAPDVHELAPHVPLPVSQVVARAMARNTSDRFTDATEMQEALLAAYRPQDPGIGLLPMMSDLPPQRGDGPLINPQIPRSSPRPISPLPRTQAVRLPGYGAANETEPPAAPTSDAPTAPQPALGPKHAASFAATQPPTPIDMAYLLPVRGAAPPRNYAGPLAITAAPPARNPLGAAVLSERPDHPEFASAEHREPVDADSTSDAPLPALGPEPPLQHVSGDHAIAPNLDDLTQAMEGDDEPSESNESIEPMAAPAAVHADSLEIKLPYKIRRWQLPVLAGTGLVCFGLLLLWMAPSGKPPRPTRSPSAPHSQPSAATSHVTLQLTGLPDGASVTLDGEPAGPSLNMPRGTLPRSVAVHAPGKLPWHISYVPNADQTLPVNLIDAPPTAAEPAAPAKKKPAAAPHKPAHKRNQSALRVPDF